MGFASPERIGLLSRISRWWERRQTRRYLVDSLKRVTDTEQLMRLHDRLRDLDAGGDGKYHRPGT